MKLQLLHGPATSSSRAKLINIKKEFDPNNVVVFEEGSDLQSILGTLVTPSLLLEDQLIILENPPEDFVFLTLDPSTSLGTGSSHLTLILWFDHEISEKKPVMEWVKKEKSEIFFFPEAREVSVFPFLDLLAAGDKRAFLELKKLKDASFEIQYFITMIFYLLRSLATTPKNAPQFVKQKLERQRKRFTQDQIKNFYKGILEIDFKIKSGLLEKDHAEFLLINKFII